MLEEIITYLIIFAAAMSVVIRIYKSIKKSKKGSPFCLTGCSMDCSTCPFASSAYRYKSVEEGSAYQFPTLEDKTDTVDLKRFLK